MPAWAAFQLTFHYPQVKDNQLIRENAAEWLQSNDEFLREFTQKVCSGGAITPRQRLFLLEHAYPKDTRLRNMRAELTKGKEKFLSEVRKDPSAAYRAEYDAIALAKKRLEEKKSPVDSSEGLLI
jgi:hypothetical protein